MVENYLDIVAVLVIFGILLSRLGGIGGIIIKNKRMVSRLRGDRD